MNRFSNPFYMFVPSLILQWAEVCTDKEALCFLRSRFLWYLISIDTFLHPPFIPVFYLLCTEWPLTPVSSSECHSTFLSGVYIFCYFWLTILLFWVSVAIQARRKPVQAPVKNLFRFPQLKIFTLNRKDHLSIAVKFGLGLKEGLIFTNDIEWYWIESQKYSQAPRAPLWVLQVPVICTSSPPPLVRTVAISSHNTLKKFPAIAMPSVVDGEHFLLICYVLPFFFICLDAIFGCQQNIISQPSCVVIHLLHPDSS